MKAEQLQSQLGSKSKKDINLNYSNQKNEQSQSSLFPDLIQSSANQASPLNALRMKKSDLLSQQDQMNQSGDYAERQETVQTIQSVFTNNPINQKTIKSNIKFGSEASSIGLKSKIFQQKYNSQSYQNQIYSKTGKHTLGETYEISESIHISLGTDPASRERGINKMTTLNSNNLTNKAKELQELSELQK